MPAGADRLQAALDRLIERQLMLIEVDRYGPPEPPLSEVDAALREIDKRIGSGERMNAILRAVRDDRRSAAAARARRPPHPLVPCCSVSAISRSPPRTRSSSTYRTHEREFTRDGVLRPFAEVGVEAREALIAERRAR